MPYVGVNVKHEQYLVRVKIHPEISALTQDELVEYIQHIARSIRLSDKNLAQYFAQKIAEGIAEDPEAQWVDVEVATSGGKTFGFTKMVKELV
jgi:hypothetical protein